MSAYFAFLNLPPVQILLIIAILIALAFCFSVLYEP
jgi:uncharacterized membrane protein YphA (DoxX/SURF4 family)